MKDIRKKALSIIDNVFYKGAFLNEELSILSQSNIDKRDYNLIVNITTGVVKNKNLLDHIIRKYSSIRIKKIHKTILSILEMGIYQLFFTDRIPEYSILNESVRLAKIFGNKGSSGFVNAILRSIVRDKEELNKSEFFLQDLKKEDLKKYLSVKYSHDEEYVSKLLTEYGEEFTTSLLQANNEEPPFTIRVNTNKVSKEELLKSLEKEGYIVKETKISKFGLIIENPVNIFNTKSFKEGQFYVQDEGSILVAELADKEYKNILDLCGSPGGKSFNFSFLYPNSKISTCDISDKKVLKINENIKRLGITNIRTFRNDATVLNDSLVGKFDLVLLDAPCSGLGLYRRKPEIKYNRGYKEVLELSKIQKSMIEIAAKYVKSGGMLVYSTCTITNEENEEVIEEFLKSKDNFKILETKGKNTLKLYPNTDGTDGFSITRLVKNWV